MTQLLYNAVIAEINSSKKKRIKTEILLDAIHRQSPGSFSDFEIRDQLLEILEKLDAEDVIRLPKTKKKWSLQSGLPDDVTAVRTEEDAVRKKRMEKRDSLRNNTAWEPVHMAAFAHTLKDIKELEKAVKVNHYLKARNPDAEPIPHRERALMIFGDEKALDKDTYDGLFKGQIPLSALDCFYCPEPIPFRPLSLNNDETGGKPLLVVENANTYWSCCRANEILQCYAAVVYGQGFQACSSERSNVGGTASTGIMEIERQTASEGILYFGDLDPVGIAIPMRINGYRREKGLTPIEAERRLYLALLLKDLTVPYAKSQKKAHSPNLAAAWLGDELANIYLEKALQVRWPQEGLTARDIIEAVRSSNGWFL